MTIDDRQPQTEVHRRIPREACPTICGCDGINLDEDRTRLADREGPIHRDPAEDVRIVVDPVRSHPRGWDPFAILRCGQGLGPHTS